MPRRSALRQSGSCRLITGIAITVGGLRRDGSLSRKTHCTWRRRNELKASNLIATSEASLGAVEAVRMYKELSEVESAASAV